jgi:hypothetical protein
MLQLKRGHSHHLTPVQPAGLGGPPTASTGARSNMLRSNDMNPSTFYFRLRP